MGLTAKINILALAEHIDLSDSYGALLYMTVLMEAVADTSAPESEEERIAWDGHMRGLVSALHCVVMHERRYAPGVTALTVASLLNQARGILHESTSRIGGRRL